MKILVNAILVLIFCAAAFAQNNQTSPCPTISITSSPETINSGQTTTFTANVITQSNKLLIYNWSVSTGKIIEGQGTSVIEVKTSYEIIGEDVTVAVEIKGLPEHCLNTATYQTATPVNCILPMILDEYEKLPFSEEKARLANAAVYLKKQPESSALFIIGFTEKESFSSIKIRVDKISKYLIESSGIAKDKIIFVFSEDTNQSTTIYLQPAEFVKEFSKGFKSLEDLRMQKQISQKP